MKNDKAAVITGVTPDMLKLPPKASIDYLTETIRKYWKGELDCEEWHMMNNDIQRESKTKQSKQLERHLP
jgi:hypothetical protein